MRGRVWLATALVIGAGLALPAISAAQAPQDSAVGSGSAGDLYPRFEFSATSDPIGGSPSGAASFEQAIFHFEGTVSCLAVNGNRAVIGIDIDQAASSVQFAGFFLTVVDGGPAGSGDRIDAVPTALAGLGDVVPTDCSLLPAPFFPAAVTSGDITVVDAPPLPTSKEQCKNGGWRSFGVFKNQGDCVSFVATSGRNQPASPLT